MSADGTIACVSKTLSANDLGITGSHQSGICIPKEPELLRFFPQLDENDHNPDCELSVRVPQTGGCHILRYIHYNGKLSGRSTRDEYRLTRTTELFRAVEPEPGDQLEFCRCPSGEIEVTLNRRGPSAPVMSPEVPTGRVELNGGWTVFHVEVGRHGQTR